MTQALRKGSALVTGASSGIGAIYAHRLARRGYDLILAARSVSRIEPLARWIRGHNSRRVETLALDLAEEQDLAWLEERIRRDGSLTMIVNDAGLGDPQVGARAAGGLVEAMMAMNVSAPARLAYAAASAFGRRRCGAIVNVASFASDAGGRFRRPDAGAAFFAELSRTLEGELGEWGVRAQLVLPDPSASGLWELARAGVEHLPREMVVLAESLVDRALAGLDAGEVITRPATPRAGDWARYEPRPAYAAIKVSDRG